MPAADLLLAFVIATAIFASMPGPLSLYAAAQTIARGQRAGWMAALCIHRDGSLHMLAAAFRLFVLFLAVPMLYVALRVGGAVCLIWHWARVILARPAPQDSEIVAQACAF